MEKLLALLKDLRAIEADDFFRPMQKEDWYAFAGADSGSLIAYGEKYTYILSPSGELTAINNEEDGEAQLISAGAL
jgi:hypothetical protein